MTLCFCDTVPVRRSLGLLLGVALLALSCGLVGTALGMGGETPAPSAPSERAAVSARPDAPQARPLLVVIGASFAAGVGAGHRSDAWPADLARMLHWRLAVSADPGAGYVNPGFRDRGPFARLAAGLGLAHLDPAVVLVQGGHDDIGEPLSLVHQRVASLLATIRREAPNARVGVVTVFWTGKRPSPAAMSVDRAIVAAARQADPPVMVFDPLAAHWRFPRIGDQLHPSPAGHRWIAIRLAAALQPHGVTQA